MGTMCEQIKGEENNEVERREEDKTQKISLMGDMLIII
jgi:hypothetical protein